jgi:hypothetical protein
MGRCAVAITEHSLKDESWGKQREDPEGNSGDQHQCRRPVMQGNKCRGKRAEYRDSRESQNRRCDRKPSTVQMISSYIVVGWGCAALWRSAHVARGGKIRDKLSVTQHISPTVNLVQPCLPPAQHNPTSHTAESCAPLLKPCGRALRRHQTPPSSERAGAATPAASWCSLCLGLQQEDSSNSNTASEHVLLVRCYSSACSV